MLLVLRLVNAGRGAWACVDPTRRVQRVNALDKRHVRTWLHPRVNYGDMPPLNRLDREQLEQQAMQLQNRLVGARKREREQRDRNERRQRGQVGSRARALRAIIGGIWSLLGWGYTRGRFGTPVAIVLSTVNTCYHLGIFEWIG